MEHDPLAASQPRRGVPTYLVEAVVAVVILAIGAVVIFESRKLGSGWSSDGPGAGVLLQSVFGKGRSHEIFVDSEQLGRVMSVLLPAALYVLAIAFVGLYVASAVYIALFMIILGKYSPVKSVVAALVIVTVFFFMFEVWFKVPLYKGSLDPLSFLGY